MEYTSPEERELKRRQTQIKRIKFWVAILVVAGMARFIIKDPPPLLQKDRSRDTFKAMPGVLEHLTVEQQRKLTPQQLAALKRADDEWKEKQYGPEDPFKGLFYQPQEIPAENSEDKKLIKEEEFLYAQRKKTIEEEKRKIQMAKEITKKHLIQFKNNRYISAEQIVRNPSRIEIRIDSTMQARIPKNMVVSVLENTPGWEEPIPKGYVRKRPAKGITVVLAKNTAKRITTLKDKSFEDDQI